MFTVILLLMMKGNLYKILLIAIFFICHFIYMTILVLQYDPSGQIISLPYLLLGGIYFVLYGLIKYFVKSIKVRVLSQELLFLLFVLYFYYLQRTDITYLKNHIFYTQHTNLLIFYVTITILYFFLFRLIQPIDSHNKTNH